MFQDAGNAYESFSQSLVSPSGVCADIDHETVPDILHTYSLVGR